MSQPSSSAAALPRSQSLVSRKKLKPSIPKSNSVGSSGGTGKSGKAALRLSPEATVAGHSLSCSKSIRKRILQSLSTAGTSLFSAALPTTPPPSTKTPTTNHRLQTRPPSALPPTPPHSQPPAATHPLLALFEQEFFPLCATPDPEARLFLLVTALSTEKVFPASAHAADACYRVYLSASYLLLVDALGEVAGRARVYGDSLETLLGEGVRGVFVGMGAGEGVAAGEWREGRRVWMDVVRRCQLVMMSWGWRGRFVVEEYGEEEGLGGIVEEVGGEECEEDIEEWAGRMGSSVAIYREYEF